MDKLRVKRAIETTQFRTIAGTEVKLSNIVVKPDAALVDSIDNVLTDVLGTRTRELFYDHLARECSLAKEEVPEHLDEFRVVLEQGLGEAASFVEKCIVRRLYATLGWQFLDIPGFGLNEHVALINGIVERTNEMTPLQ
jgi:hypothetical protein